MANVDWDGTFDIFRQDDAGAIWVQAVHGHDEAIQSLLKLRAEKPEQVFLLWDSRTRRFLDLPASSRTPLNE
ncbi:MAG TPA: hypothetical protein VKT50_06250 [Candidatus Acidoferrales bacterium]|nr:hypothetical protein [Candidatus Acidoferrales bacterium]